ncbi:protein C19orf12 homolog isoform X2 [Hylaeus volcanicus]|nr:protein C19orf12 homolog isoform X2 [Hylaeus volcanicus]XP_053986350.1 protein C19orf12 homolog isoform X2 [Hylaeus volcanicus]XP_053986351.1 protein C19orf12 homolog isoform X2 [Hylaeus volcanicus]XP_053986352.1 protein C19orf12 homolog isoform X2 [Hylaeus volcanicus]
MVKSGQLGPSRRQNEYCDDELLLEEILNLQAVKEMKFTTTSSIKYGTIVGAATIVSGVLGGPVGLTVGGIVSSCIAGYVCQEYESVPYILLCKATPAERQKLLKVILNYLRKHNVTIVETLYALHSKEALILGIQKIIREFLMELGLEVVKTW